MPRWFKIILWSVLGLGIAGYASLSYISWSISNSPWDFSNSSDDHWVARADFLAQFDGIDCLIPDTIRAEAIARDFEVWDLQNDLRWCHSPTGLQNWLGVEVMPPQSFSSLDENSEYFGFDENGCMVPWTDASGPGTTCPSN